MFKTSFRGGAVLCVAALFLSGFALAVGIPVVVPDTGNNRVLIYYSPSGNGAPADVVLGQSSFTTGASGTSSSAMSAPTAFTFDSSGNLYVSDSGNCRVLMFAPPFATGQDASLVIGQPDFTTGCGAAASASTVGTTGGIAFGPHGNFWVADSSNNRVLKFDVPLKTGMAAKGVIGQPDYVSNACPNPPSAASLCSPTGVAFDSEGVLWIADSSNNRVLGYRPATTRSASAEYGQPAATAFTSNTANNGGVSATSLYDPTGIAFDSSNELWVADTQNNRVLIFKRTVNKNGTAAIVVLGQTNFTGSTENPGGVSAATMWSPWGIITNAGSTPWVGDSFNCRTLQFTPPFSNGENASLELGQPDFNSNSSNQGYSSPSATTQDSPFGPGFFNAGPSLISLVVLLSLAVGAYWLRRRQQRAQSRCL